MATDSHTDDNRRAQSLIENAPQSRILEYLSNQYRELSYTHPDERPDEWRVNFAGLQRMVLAKLQEDLIAKVRQIEHNGHQATVQTLAEIEPILARYTIAVRDWEFMVEHAANTDGDIAKDLFVLSAKRPLSHRLMQENGMIEIGWDSRCVPEAPKAGDTYLPGGQRRRVNEEKERLRQEEIKRNTSKARLQRLGMGVFGGIAFIAPMLLMVLHLDRTAALATTSVSMLLFAFFISFLPILSADRTLEAVAAYAAVLVVFVGAALPPT